MTVATESAALTTYICYISFIMALLFIIAMYHFRAIYKTRKDDMNEIPWSVYLSVLMISLSFIQFTDFMLLILPSIPGWYCFIQIRIGPICYTSFKACLYIILLSRLWSRNSVKCQKIFNYNPIYVKIWSIIIISWSVINGILMNIGGTAIFAGNDIFPKCTNDLSDISLMMSAGLDFVAGTVNLYLFVKPLFSILHQIKDRELKSLVIRLSILSVFTIISTIIALIICMFANGTPIFIFAVGGDELISTLCIILMYKWNTWITDRLLLFCLPSKSMITDDMKNLEIVTDTVSNNQQNREDNISDIENGDNVSNNPVMMNIESNVSVISTASQAL